MNLFIIVEGWSEREFAYRVLRNHLRHTSGIHLSRAMALGEVSRRLDKSAAGEGLAGGVSNYNAVREEIFAYYEDGTISAADVLTTMLDLYALPVGFPGCAEAVAQGLTGDAKASHIEQAWRSEIGIPELKAHCPRFKVWIERCETFFP